MKFTIETDYKFSAQTRYEDICGHAFAFNPHTRLVLVGGAIGDSSATAPQLRTTLLRLDAESNASTLVKHMAVRSPLKWQVSNYEWDVRPAASAASVGGNGDATSPGPSEQYLQTVFCIAFHSSLSLYHSLARSLDDDASFKKKRNKLLEIVDTEASLTVVQLYGHTRPIRLVGVVVVNRAYSSSVGFHTTTTP